MHSDSPHTASPAGLAEVNRAWYYGNPRQEVLALLPEPARIRRLLDVGCANGAFGALVKQQLGAEVWGLELREDVAQVAAQRLDRVLIGSASARLAELPPAYFDCVTCNDVLEHLEDPGGVLAALRGHIAPGGHVMASLPNMRHYPVLYDLVVRGNWDYADYGVLDRTHLRFFTLKSIHKLFDAAGYRLTRVEGINGPTSPSGRRLSRLLPPPLRDIQFMQFVCIAQPR